MKKSTILSRFFKQMTDNPIVIKELRGRMRGRRAFVVLTIYLALLSLFVAGIYQMISYNGNYNTPEYREQIGKTLFGSVIGFEFLLIGFIGPALTAGAITGERERKTLDLLRTTLISPRVLVFGKLSTACAYLLLLMIAATPIQALAFLFGGIGLEELFVANLLLLVNILFFCSLGILCSSIAQRTLTATIASYSTIIVSIIGTVITIFTLIQSEPYIRHMIGNTDLYSVIAWHICATNSALAAIISELVFIDNHIFIYGKAPFGQNIYLFSPWVMNVALAFISAIIMILISNLLVNRPER